MERSAREVPLLIERESSPTTNSELVALAVHGLLPAFTTLVTTDQTAGRGRLGRVWTAPTGTSLAASVLVPPPEAGAFPADALGWLPLAAGVAMTDAVAPHVTGTVGVKWPNDVLIDGRKVCGILSELVPGGSAVVIGSGLNVTMTSEQLPVPAATSLVIAGASVDGGGVDGDGIDLADDVLAVYLRRLRELVTALWATDGDAEASGLRTAVVERCLTIGRAVRVELPGDLERSGLATGIDRLGRLEVREDAGRVEAVAAGDIVHLR